MWTHLIQLLPAFLLKGVPQTAPETEASTRHVVLSLPRQLPAFAEKLDSNLVAFSIEADRWPDWAGYEVGKPNEFYLQCLKNLAERTGSTPSIRVGADSEDRTHVDLSLPVGHATFPKRTPAFPYPEAERIAVGRDWYALSANLPAGTHFTWGLNLKSLNRSETVEQAKLLADTFQGSRAELTKHVKLQHIEIGNEPDLYIRAQSGGGVSNPGDWSAWTPANYSATWSDYVKAIAKVVDLSETKMRVGALAKWVPDNQSWSSWTPQSLLNAGLLDDAEVRKVTSTFSEHLYSGGAFTPEDPQKNGDLMSKAHLRTTLGIRAAEIQAARREGLEFVMGETNSYANYAQLGMPPSRHDASCPETLRSLDWVSELMGSHGSPGLSNAAESAIWGIDYLLQSAALGISRVYLSHGVGYRYSSIQPVSGVSDDGSGLSRPHIMPLYYGMLFVNDFIGTEGSQGKEVRIAELGLDDTRLAGYGAWVDGKLKRIAIISSQLHMGKDNTGLTVEIPDLGPDTQVRQLLAPRTDSTSHITWAGISFDTSDGKGQGQVVEEKLKHRSINVAPSSAVLLTLA